MESRDTDFNRVARVFGPLDTAELRWRWNIENDDFDMDFRALEKIIGTQIKIHDFSDFYKLFSEEDQNKLLTYIESCMRGDTANPISLSVVNESNNTFQFTLKADNRYKTRFEGSIRYSLNLPDSNDLLKVFHQVFNNEHHGMVITDEKTHILTCNSYFEKYSGYQFSELVGKKTNVFNAGKHGDLFFTEMWSQIHYYGFWSGMILSKRKNGNIEPQELTIQKLESGDKVFYLGITRDMSKSLYRLEGKEYGGIELLTQLPSKKGFQLQLEAMFDGLAGQQSMMTIVIKLNDEEEKDLDVTQEISSALSLGATNQIAGFLGGNVFSCAIAYKKEEGGKEYSTIYKVIRALIEQLRKALSPRVYRVLAKSTIGVSVLNEDTEDVSKMVPNALKAMYERHSKTGSNICFYNNAMHYKYKRRERLERVVRSTISEKKVEVNYQPIFDATDWSIKKFETLCRFKDTNGGVLNTLEVIEIATELDLVNDLDLIVAETALNHRKELAKKHGADIGVSINLSLNTQRSVRTVLTNLVQLVKKYPLDAKYLSIELADHIDLHDGANSHFLNELVNLEVTLILDDFLTGQSVFSHINDNRFKYLKIERDFVRGITKKSSNYAILRSITALAHSMGLKVIAKGVENIAEVKVLYGLGIDFMQGFYFAHPIVLEKVAPYSGYIRKVKELRKVCAAEQQMSLIRNPTELRPNDSLAYVREIFESSSFNVLPVINNRICVGMVDKESYNLHLSPTLGTSIETTNDVKTLNKRVHQVMNPLVHDVPADISKKDMIYNIENGIHPPWVVVDTGGRYIGMIEKDQVLTYLCQAAS